ncbi:hypothetical protein TIFTF001_036341 [Ficus carica]|uniref:Uncharacterized protein n=1 Tax=Ficus carica TaxID=3494 RepID=A0AA88J7J9_FICCA|nr:hypothetical protein TIFTF001_036341 [Ficus carica]
MAAPGSGVSSLDEIQETILFKLVMEGDWETIVNQYERDPNTHRQKVTWLGDTALHVAVAEGLEDTVKKLLQVILLETAPVQGGLEAQNDDGNTPLHIAASIGSAAMCQEIAQLNKSLVSYRNKDGETPLFLAADQGHTDAFLCLVDICDANDARYSYCRRLSDGQTVLHSAIFGQYFSEYLAYDCLFIYLFSDNIKWTTYHGVQG